MNQSLDPTQRIRKYAQALEGLAERLELPMIASTLRDATRQRLEPRERGAELVQSGLERTPVLLFSRERVRRELCAALDQCSRLLDELGLENHLALDAGKYPACVDQKGACVHRESVRVTLRLRGHARRPVEREPARAERRGR